LKDVLWSVVRKTWQGREEGGSSFGRNFAGRIGDAGRFSFPQKDIFVCNQEKVPARRSSPDATSFFNIT
jgi:hypothetical protein